MAAPVPNAPHPSETPGERERLAEAYADIAAGRVISGDEALEWLDRWAAGEELDEPSVK